MTLPLQFQHSLPNPAHYSSFANGYSFTSFLPILPLKQILLSFSFSCTKINRNNYHSLPFRFPPTQKNSRRGNGGASVAVCYSAIRSETLQWVCSVSSVVLMLAKGTAI